MLSLSLGCGGCCASAWEWKPFCHRSEEQGLAFHHSWKQRCGLWIVLCNKSVFFSNFSVAHFVPSSLVGILRVWEASTARCVYTQTLPTVSEDGQEVEVKEDDPRSLTYLLHLPASSRLATVTAEHNILLYQLPELSTQQQVGSQKTEIDRDWHDMKLRWMLK